MELENKLEVDVNYRGKKIKLLMPKRNDLVNEINRQFDRCQELLDTSKLENGMTYKDLFHSDGSLVEEFKDKKLFFRSHGYSEQPTVSLSEIHKEKLSVMSQIERIYEDEDYLRIQVSQFPQRKDGYISKKFSTGQMFFAINSFLGKHKHRDVYYNLELWVLVKDFKNCYMKLEWISRRFYNE